MVEHSNAEREARQAKLAEFLLHEIREDGNGGLRLQQLLRAAQDNGYSEGETRAVLRRKERDGEVYADWNWRYHVAS